YATDNGVRPACATPGQGRPPGAARGRRAAGAETGPGAASGAVAGPSASLRGDDPGRRGEGLRGAREAGPGDAGTRLADHEPAVPGAGHPGSGPGPAPGRTRSRPACTARPNAGRRRTGMAQTAAALAPADNLEIATNLNEFRAANIAIL